MDTILVKESAITCVWRNRLKAKVEESGPHDGALFELTADPPACFGMRYINGQLLPPLPTARSVEELRGYAATKRWRVETGGISINGLPVPTNDRAKILIMGAAGALGAGDTAPFVFGGKSQVLTGAQFKAVYAAIVAHVQACFAAQEVVLAAITAGDLTTFEEIDAANWPINT